MNSQARTWFDARPQPQEHSLTVKNRQTFYVNKLNARGFRPHDQPRSRPDPGMTIKSSLYYRELISLANAGSTRRHLGRRSRPGRSTSPTPRSDSPTAAPAAEREHRRRHPHQLHHQGRLATTAAPSSGRRPAAPVNSRKIASSRLLRQAMPTTAPARREELRRDGGSVPRQYAPSYSSAWAAPFQWTAPPTATRSSPVHACRSVHHRAQPLNKNVDLRLFRCPGVERWREARSGCRYKVTFKLQRRRRDAAGLGFGWLHDGRRLPCAATPLEAAKSVAGGSVAVGRPVRPGYKVPRLVLPGWRVPSSRSLRTMRFPPI